MSKHPFSQNFHLKNIECYKNGAQCFLSFIMHFVNLVLHAKVIMVIYFPTGEDYQNFRTPLFPFASITF